MAIASFKLDGAKALLAEIKSAAAFVPVNGSTAPAIMLVSDQAVALSTNVALPQRGVVVIAHGCDPMFDDNFYENRVSLFGPDFCELSFSPELIEQAIAAGKTSFQLNINKDEVQVVL